MKTDRIFKFAIASLFINLLYSIYNGIIGIASNSLWFLSLSVYYTVLSISRFLVLNITRKSRKNSSAENSAKKLTGFMFILLSISLVGTTILTLSNDKETKYHEIVMISISVFTFTKVTLAIVNLVKAKKHDSSVIKALRSISFCDAFVSIFSMQRSMLVSFPGLTDFEIKIFNILTGSAVCLLIFILGIGLISERKFNMSESKFVKVNRTIAHKVVGIYKIIEKAVVGCYFKIEDKFIDVFLRHDSETIEETKERIKKK